MNKWRCFVAAAIAADVFVAGAFEVSGVVARQRWPWNSLVDIDYDISGANAGDSFAVSVTAAYNSGAKTIVGKTFRTDPVAASGSNRLVWDFAADAPGVKATDLQISVTVTPLSDAPEIYCVIDVSGGKDAEKYPVRYTTVPPVHTPKCTNDVCKLTEIWFKRVHPAGRDFTVGNWKTPAANNSSYYTRLTKDYYIGVFEVTQQQWYQIAGTWPSFCSNAIWRATRPLDMFYPELLFGRSKGWRWPDDKELDATCLLKRLRDRTGIATLNLPTDAQWQFAASAGPTNGREIYRYCDPQGNQYGSDEITRYSGNSGTYSKGDGDLDNGSAAVGCYKPNAFGLYDMLGNVSEDCLDPYVRDDLIKEYFAGKGAGFPIVDPQGIPREDARAMNGNALRITVRTQRAFAVSSEMSTLWRRDGGRVDYASDSSPAARGFRFCVTCE